MSSRAAADPTVNPRDDSVEHVEVAPSSKSLEALAWSVGHALNNPLAALLTNLDLALVRLRDERDDPHVRTAEALELLSDVQQAAQRIQAVVQRLRATAIPTQVPPPPATPSTFTVAASLTDASLRNVRVLVVDDDVMVGNALKRSLRDYDVVALDDARGALARFVAGERFDVIFCDLMMPEMTGMDLHEEVLRVAQDQAERMVFMTGGAITTRARDFVAASPNPVLDKPFDVKVLREMIRARAGT